jgi:hypothetical protein
MSPFDPHSYTIGDPIYVSYPRGWNAYGAIRYIVKRITAKGQITASNERREIRITARGRVVGQSGYHTDFIVTAEQAQRYAQEAREDARWNAIRDAGTAIERAGRTKDAEALRVACDQLASAIEARSDATGTGAAVGESAGPEGEAP